MNMLMVTHYFGEHKGGVELIAEELATRFSKRGIKVTWAASDCTMPSQSSSIVYEPMNSMNMTEKMIGLPYPLWSPRSLVRLFSLVKSHKSVFIHDCLYFGNIAAFLFAKVHGKRTIVVQHIGEVPFKSRLLRAIMNAANFVLGKLILGSADQVFFISKKVQNYFEPFVSYRNPPILNYNGVDLEKFHPLDQLQREFHRKRFGWTGDAAQFLFVGRFVEKKGLAFLRKLVELLPDCQFNFIGWGPIDPNAWQLKNVHCLGPKKRHELPAYFAASDLLVLPSVGEGFPLVVQEALATGTPAAISPDTAKGCIGCEKVALVVELCPEFWAKELSKFLTLGSEQKSLRQRSREFAEEQWSWNQCIEKYLQYLKNPTVSELNPCHQESAP